MDLQPGVRSHAAAIWLEHLGYLGYLEHSVHLGAWVHPPTARAPAWSVLQISMEAWDARRPRHGC